MSNKFTSAIIILINLFKKVLEIKVASLVRANLLSFIEEN